MEIVTLRVKQGLESTLGKLLVNGDQYVYNKRGVYVLEDQDRGLYCGMTEAEIAKIKVYGRTAIPLTKPDFPYLVKLTMSKKFGNVLWPQLMGVPGYDGIRPHAGNYIADTLGCQLTGINPDQDKLGYWRVWDSRNTFGPLKAAIVKALTKGERVTWAIKKAY